MGIHSLTEQTVRNKFSYNSLTKNKTKKRGWCTTTTSMRRGRARPGKRCRGKHSRKEKDDALLVGGLKRGSFPVLRLCRPALLDGVLVWSSFGLCSLFFFFLPQMLLLLLVLCASLGGGRLYAKEIKACEDAKCRKAVMGEFRADTRLRVHTLAAEEHLRAELKAAHETAKCQKLTDAEAKNSCLRGVREQEVRRKASLMRRTAHEAFAIGKKSCKKLKKKKTQKKCSKEMKYVHQREITRIETRTTRMIGLYTAASVLAEAQFAYLLPEASACSTVACQVDLASNRCPMKGDGHYNCKRLVLQAPLNVGTNKYLVKLQQDLAECNFAYKCEDKVYNKFRTSTESQIKDYARTLTQKYRSKLLKSIAACKGDKKCETLAQSEYWTKVYSARERIVSVSFNATMRHCDKLKKRNKKAGGKCRKLAIKERKMQGKMMYKRIKRSMKRLIKRFKKGGKKLADKLKKKSSKKKSKAEKRAAKKSAKYLRIADKYLKKAIKRGAATSSISTTTTTASSSSALTSGTTTAVETTVPAAVASFVDHLNRRDIDGMHAWNADNSAVHALGQESSFSDACVGIDAFVTRSEALLQRLGRAARSCSSSDCFDAYSERLAKLTTIMDNRQRRCANAEKQE